MNVADLVVRPVWLPWLVVVPLLAWVLGRVERARRSRARVLFGPRIAATLARGRPVLVPLVAAGALAAALVAGAGPRIGPGDADLLEGLDIVIALDVSRSMDAEDVEPSRLARARAEIAALGGRLGSHRAALIAFAGDARLLVPTTRDGGSLTRRVQDADPTTVGVGGTNLAAALDAAGRALASRTRAQACVVLLTDGEDLADEDALAAARRLAATGISVHAFGLGSARGARIPDRSSGGFVRDAEGREVVSRVDEDGLRALASATGGTVGWIESNADSGVLVRWREMHLDDVARAVHAREGDGGGEGEAWRPPLALAWLGTLWLFAFGGRRRR